MRAQLPRFPAVHLAAVLLIMVGSVGCRSSRPLDPEGAEMLGDASSRRGDTVTAEEMEQRPAARTIIDLLTARVPGLITDGESRIRIRGYDGEPLFVVDGVHLLALPSIPPADVKSIRVLKGPETAIYGMRGVNGVVEIRTRRRN